MKISSYKSRVKKELKPVVFFFFRFIKRKARFFFFTSEIALRKATSGVNYQSDSNSGLRLIEKDQSAGLVIKSDVISIPLVAGSEKEFCGGLLDSQTGSLITEAVHLMGEPCQEIPKDKNFNVETEINHTVFFGGILYDNFGHVLLESISRLWAYTLVKQSDPYIYFFVPWDTPKYLEKQNHVYQIFEGFGIPHKKIIFTNKKAKLKRVIIAPQKYGFELCKYPDHYFMDFLKTFKYKKSTPANFEKADKVYVSRSKIKYGLGKPIGEKYFEAFLESNGYKVFYPELYMVNEQLTVYANAEKIIFCDGSALHSCILLPDITADIAIIARRKYLNLDSRTIADQFIGFGKEFLWVNEVGRQYQFGLQAWSAIAEVDWYKASVQLLEHGFIKNSFTAFSELNYDELTNDEIKSYVDAIRNRPEFLSFLRDNYI
jgi:hypothetical protein